MGTLSERQEEVVAGFVAGKIVHDLGAGDLQLAHRLLVLGATQVIAVDKERCTTVTPQITCVRATFDEWLSRRESPADVIFLSYPINHRLLALLQLVEEARLVVYLGKNTDGTVCGWPGLFAHFLRRDLLAYVPERRNSLAVYGGHLESYRHPKGEELAGLSTDVSRILSYEETEAF